MPGALAGAFACVLAFAAVTRAGSEAPAWLHAAAAAPLPAQDEKTNAVLLYSERTVTIRPDHTMEAVVREAYKILRPGGRNYGEVLVNFGSGKKVAALHGWCIPAQGKDYEVKDKDAVEISLPNIEGSELVSDVKMRVLKIPAADPGNVVGYEYRTEERPLVLQDNWQFQEGAPVRESHYTLQLPPGWEYKASWLNYPETRPTEAGSGAWQWALSDVKAIRPEDDMPPLDGVSGQMLVSFIPPGGTAPDGFTTWQGMGKWYEVLTKGRRDATPEIKQQVASLTASATTPLEKMRALAKFVQGQVRYVAIELGVGGFQPNPASTIFINRYGDCKDKVTLLSSMLGVIGVDSYYVLINSRRGSVTPNMPAHNGFDHAILAVKLPDGVNDPSLEATLQVPGLGRILFFDPTDELTPFGKLLGELQGDYALLVAPGGGQLVDVPMLPPASSGIERTAKLTLGADGTLKGEVSELRSGDRAWDQRWALRTVTNDLDRIKPIEHLLADSLSSFQITKAALVNFQLNDQPLGFTYTIEAPNYARTAGQLILVRPRVMGSKSSGLLETKEPRKFAIEFEGPARDTDTFDIALPPGYVVDDLPPPVDVDYSFASYHSRTSREGNAIRYSRTFEIKQLTVPAESSPELKKFYRIIASDERNTAVLRPASQ